MPQRFSLITILAIFTTGIFSQPAYVRKFLEDSTLNHASVSLMLLDADSQKIIASHNGSKSLSQASVMKLVTTAAALELLGEEYRFRTEIGYTGAVKKGTLEGDIVIRGGGDPVLGSDRFSEHYGDILADWADKIGKTGIKRIRGRVITDDSRYDHEPVPPGWNWEDIGNYYGAGAFGLSIFDNTIKIHFRTGETGSKPVITAIDPPLAGINYKNLLTAEGSSDQGYVYCAPYSIDGWITGHIPVNKEDFILKASIPDPPLLAAVILDSLLRASGIRIKERSSTSRIENTSGLRDFRIICETLSPPLSAISEVLNHESVNHYAEHLVKELGVVSRGKGSTEAGTEVIKEWIASMGLPSAGMFIEDGSGLSPQNALSSESLAMLLAVMKNRGKYFTSFYNSLPEAGKEGTVKNYFRDPLFESSLRAKSGTLLRVKSYAGYLKAKSGRNIAFSIIVNNFTGSSSYLIGRIEELLKGVITDE